jgi:hypothetical protein
MGGSYLVQQQKSLGAIIKQLAEDLTERKMR